VVVLGISGSLRADSFNTALLRAAAGLLPVAARLPLYTDLALLPPYSEEADAGPAPPPVEHLRVSIESADALLIATPEYNASIPGQLKNALDWASRPYPGNALRRKPVAVVGASTGLFGAVWAQAELRKVLATAGADVLDDELAIGTAHEAFDDNLALADHALSARLEGILAGLLTRAVSDDRDSRSCQRQIRSSSAAGGPTVAGNADRPGGSIARHRWRERDRVRP
jgi:chromate reductase, NAD(P)H dehydrogenase (quinone)